MDMNKITSWFSREMLGGLILAVGVAAICQSPAAMAQSFQGTFQGPSQTVQFSNGGPTAVLNMPAVQVSNFDQNAAVMAAQDANATGAAGAYNGANGSTGNTSYKTGSAPEDANMSGLTTQKTGFLNPTSGPGTNYGLTPMTNGLMAPFTVNQASIPQFDGLGYGFNMSPQNQVYNMPYGINGLIDGVINNLGGGIITTGPLLPVTSTGSVNLNTTLGNGY